MELQLSFCLWNRVYDDSGTKHYNETPIIEKDSIEYLNKSKSGKPIYKYVNSNGDDLLLVFTKNTLEVIAQTGDMYVKNTYVDFYNIQGELPEFISKDL